eukprot:11723929-Ditylum_brightwellii.AAC.1
MAYASVFGFTQSIQRRIDWDLPETEDTVIAETNVTAADNAQKAKKANSIAMASFTMVFTSELLIVMVYVAMTMDCPGGLAYKIVVVLHKKHAP